MAETTAAGWAKSLEPAGLQAAKRQTIRVVDCSINPIFCLNLFISIFYLTHFHIYLFLHFITVLSLHHPLCQPLLSCNALLQVLQSVP